MKTWVWIVIIVLVLIVVAFAIYAKKQIDKAKQDAADYAASHTDEPPYVDPNAKTNVWKVLQGIFGVLGDSKV